jgi:hypothetical protein
MLSAGNTGHPPTVGTPTPGEGLGLGCAVAAVVAVGLGVDVGVGVGVKVGLGVDVATAVLVGTCVAVRVGVRVFFACDARALPADGAAAAAVLPTTETRHSVAPSTKIFAFTAYPPASC